MLTGEVQLSSAKLMFYYLIISIVGDKVSEIIYNDEIFKPTSIQDYYISADGKVLSLKKNSPYLMQSHICHGGHYRIELHNNRVPKKYLIHRLVYEAWIGPLDNELVIEHLDNNPANNHYTNLKQSTQKENIQTCIKAGNRVGNLTQKFLFNQKEQKYYKFKSVKDLLTVFNLKGDSLNKFKKSKERMKTWQIIDNKTLEGQSTIETIDFNEVKSKNGVEYFVGENPAKEARSN